MINSERLEQAIAVMRRAGKVDMRTWQSGQVKSSESRIHACGNTACFAGWLAVSPEFINSGGWLSPLSGAPGFNERLGAHAVIEWLEAEGGKAEVLELLISNSARISSTTAEWLKSKNIQAEVGRQESGGDYTYTHLINWSNFKADDVIKILEALRD